MGGGLPPAPTVCSCGDGAGGNDSEVDEDHDEDSFEAYAHIKFSHLSFLQDDVEKYMSSLGTDSAEDSIKILDEQLRKYKYMELNLLSKKKR